MSTNNKNPFWGNPWHFVWISTLSSVSISCFLARFLSSIILGEILNQVVLIVMIAGAVIPLIVAPPVIYFILKIRKNYERQLVLLSHTDDLTGLNNRRGFFLLANKQLKIAQRFKTGIYLLYADIDDFKSINDTLGHKTGDKVLIDLARILKDYYRSSDLIGRMGGDEFVIFPIGTTLEGVEIIIKRFDSIIKEYNSQEKRGYNLSISTGISYFDPESPISLDELLVTADNAMYKTKKEKTS